MPISQEIQPEPRDRLISNGQSLTEQDIINGMNNLVSGQWNEEASMARVMNSTTSIGSPFVDDSTNGLESTINSRPRIRYMSSATGIVNTIRGTSLSGTISSGTISAAALNGENSCEHCGENPTQGSHFPITSGLRICNTCITRIGGVSCANCKKPVLTITDRVNVGGKEIYVCVDCLKEYDMCIRCGTYVKNLLLTSCDACITNFLSKPREISMIPLNEGTLKYRTQQEGTVMKSLRAIGIELEATCENEREGAKACVVMPYGVGVGTDGSVSGRGIEVRTPPSNGAKFEGLTNEICRLMKGSFSINASCGFHVHLDMSDVESMGAAQQLLYVKNVFIAYLAFEDVLLSFLPPSRRERNRYCRPLRSEYSMGEILNTRNIDELERLWYRVRDTHAVMEAKGDNHHQTRYRGINFHPFFRAKHIEIRYHTGTLRPEKIIEWASLHARIIDTAATAALGASLFSGEMWKEVINITNITQKTGTFFDWLRLPSTSKNYFRARQEVFKVKESTTDTSSLKAGFQLLEQEKEI